MHSSYIFRSVLWSTFWGSFNIFFSHDLNRIFKYVHFVKTLNLKLKRLQNPASCTERAFITITGRNLKILFSISSAFPSYLISHQSFLFHIFNIISRVHSDHSTQMHYHCPLDTVVTHLLSFLFLPYLPIHFQGWSFTNTKSACDTVSLKTHQWLHIACGLTL